MAQYIVTANKLNRRKTIPSVLPDAKGIADTVSKNFMFEGAEVTPVPNPALGKWFKDNNGLFYWGGAIGIVATIPVQPPPASGVLVNLQQAKAATVSTTANAQVFLPYINEAVNKFTINTPIRLLCFLAQTGHESGGLFFTEEIASGTRYEGRLDLGNTQPGDGVRFKGRGLIQITGRANYHDVGNALGVDFIGSPSFLGGKDVNHCSTEQLKNAALSAGWFWNKHKLNSIADKIDINIPIETESNFNNYEAITHIINGGFNGLPDRLARYNAGVGLFV